MNEKMKKTIDRIKAAIKKQQYEIELEKENVHSIEELLLPILESYAEEVLLEDRIKVGGHQPSHSNINPKPPKGGSAI